MHECADADELAALASALGWRAEERLAHLVSCERCRDRLRQVEELRELLHAPGEVDDAFVSNTITMISRTSVPASRMRWVAGGARTGLLVAAMVFMLLSLRGSPGTGGAAWPTAVLALIIGAAAAVFLPRGTPPLTA